MSEKENKAKLREIKKALKAFPAEVRRQERAHLYQMKVQKRFGKLSLESPTVKKRVKVNTSHLNYDSLT